MKRTQRGITLIETIGALAVASMMLYGLASTIDTSMADTKGQQTGLHHAQIVTAAGKYISANYTALSAATGGGAVVAVTVAQLKSGNFLSNNLSTTNAYSQTPCVLIRQPTSGKLDALVATSGGTVILDKDLSTVAAYAGQGGGYIANANPTTARGSSWSVVTTPFRGVSCGGGGSVLTGAAADGGHLASNLFYDGPGQLSTDFLYRSAVPGRPELNQMNAPVRMDNSALVSKGSDCKISGVAVAALAFDSTTKRLVTCDATSGLWSDPTQWKAPVATYASLPFSATQVGDVRMVTELNRAFTYNGSSWDALAVDQNGDLYVPKTVDAGTLSSRGDTNVGRDLNVARDFLVAGDGRIQSDFYLGGNGYIWGDVQTYGNINTTGNVNADLDINAKGSMNSDHVVTAQIGMVTPQYIFSMSLPASGNCNILVGYSSNGSPIIAWPTGALVTDGSGRVMTCASDNTFRYTNNSYMPP